MEKMNLSMLLFLLYLTSLCKAEEYDNYYYDDYNYDRNYDYNNQESEDYTADYNQELNDYYGHQNLLAPAPPPPFIPPPPPPATTHPPPPEDFNSCINNWCHQNGTMGQYTRCKSVSNNGRTCHNPEIKFGSSTGGKPGGMYPNFHPYHRLTIWCRQLFPMATNPKIYGTARYKSGLDSSTWPQRYEHWGKNYPEFRPESRGTWNLWWCEEASIWCDCKLWDKHENGKCEKCSMSKNSTLSNPINHTGFAKNGNDHFTKPLHPCTCHGTNCLEVDAKVNCINNPPIAACMIHNFGEMESVTCHLCTPQDEQRDRKLYGRRGYYDERLLC